MNEVQDILSNIINIVSDQNCIDSEYYNFKVICPVCKGIGDTPVINYNYPSKPDKLEVCSNCKGVRVVGIKVRVTRD